MHHGAAIDLFHLSRDRDQEAVVACRLAGVTHHAAAGSAGEVVQRIEVIDSAKGDLGDRR